MRGLNIWSQLFKGVMTPSLDSSTGLVGSIYLSIGLHYPTFEPWRSGNPYCCAPYGVRLPPMILLWVEFQSALQIYLQSVPPLKMCTLYSHGKRSWHTLSPVAVVSCYCYYVSLYLLFVFVRPTSGTEWTSSWVFWKMKNGTQLYKISCSVCAIR